ncbi:exported protein of unknown function[Include putative peptidoglycan binding domain] [Magnetospira sp. QH-2]|nr:exported protein of unknown function[Include putative peptidoglycan binding domain] [Magnetospira sp. QH-2]
MRLLAALLMLSLLAPPIAWAAKPIGLPPSPPRNDFLLSDPLVVRVQQALADEGLYKGPINGLMGAPTARAIRAYQRRSGLKEDGAVSEELAQHIETAFQIRNLLQRLEKARSTNIENARKSLLDNPATRHLLDALPDGAEIADPTRDTTACFSAPTPACLLGEAAESTKAVSRDELRFWALGEVLVAQAKAGLAEAATETLRRIGDPRLVMRSLRDIAIARAAAGRIDEALEAAAIIPDPLRRAEALTAIANESKDRGPLSLVHASLESISDQDRRIALMTRLAVTQALQGAVGDADHILQRAEKMARRPENKDILQPSLRRIAAALADMGHPERALSLLDEMTDSSERTAVLIAAAMAQARKGQTDAALITAETIVAERYRPSVLAQIALSQAKAGALTSARATLDRALSEVDAIEFPYAKAYAASRAVLAMIEMLATTKAYDVVTVLETMERIEDPRLKAEALWALSGVLADHHEADALPDVRLRAEQTSETIRSRLSRVWMFAELTSSRMLKGDVPAAHRSFRKGLSVAADMGNAWGRARALAKLASALVDLEK